MSTTIPSSRAKQALLVLVLGGALLRLAAVAFEPPLHPDEYFQYLEPAWWHLSGNGLAAWEWERGLRSWVLPIYNGAWMALMMQLGVKRGAQLGVLMQAHWALLNVSIVWLAFRGGSSLSRRLNRRDSPGTGHTAGLLAASLCAGFPLLVRYAAHTLSELPSMLCMLAGLVLTAELCEQPKPEAPSSLQVEARPRAREQNKAALAGVLLSLGACLRIVNGPLVLVPTLWLLGTGRLKQLGVLILAALAPVLLFAFVDLLTWGEFAGSFIEYVKFNFVEDGASNFGREPPSWYVLTLIERAPLSLSLLVPLALWGLRATWPYLISAFGLVSYLSLLAHKEERFIIGFWPLLLIAAAGPLGAWLERAAERRKQASSTPSRVAKYGAPALAALVVGLVLLNDAGNDAGAPAFLSSDRVAAQTWAGQRPDLTGLLLDEPYHSAAGLWFGNTAPQLPYRDGLLSNPIVSHVLVPSGSAAEHATLAAGFTVQHRQGKFVVLGRAKR